MERTFAPIVMKGLLNLWKQILQSGVQVLDDVSRGEDVQAAIKRMGKKRMGKKSINRAPTRKNASRKKTVTGNRLAATKKKEYQWIFCKGV